MFVVDKEGIANMFAAYKNINTKEKISINDAVKGEEYFCPGCKKRLFVVTPKYKRAYFSHYKNESCIDYWKYDDTEWSDRMKSRFNINDVETPVEINKELHHIDINIKNRLAIMLQTGTIHASTLREKTGFILGTGYKVLWLFNFEEMYKAGKITENYWNKNMTWNVPSRMFEGYEDNPKVYIALEIKDDERDSNIAGFAMLERIDELYDSKTIFVKRWLTRDQFVQYYNDIADGKDPEEPYRIIEEQQRKELEARRAAEQKAYEERMAAQRKAAEERRLQQLKEEEEKQRREEEEKRIRQEKYLEFIAEQERKRKEEAEQREKEIAERRAKQLEREKEQKAIREMEEALQLLECKHTIVELWNEYNPRQFITVSNKYGAVYRIDRNPSEQLARYGRIYGEPKGDRLGAPSEVIADANEPIWKKNHAM